jgi:small subunit ribosomal protein S15
MWRQRLVQLVRQSTPSSLPSTTTPTCRLVSSSAAPSDSSSSSTATPLYKYLTPASLVQSAPEPVERALNIDNADAPERKQAEKQIGIEKFGVRPGDTGSTPVQVACLTVRIQHVKEHCAANRQDKAARRGYTALLTRRRNLMQYLRRKDFGAYQNVIKELNLTGFS